MAPMEIRPVIAGEVVDAASGRRGRGEVAPMSCSAKVDGPWLFRPVEDFPGEVERLVGLLREVSAAGADRAADGFGEFEQFVLGVQAAACWTLGVSGKAPLMEGALVLNDENVFDRLVMARIAGAISPRVKVYAEGVLAWLNWITGVAAVVVYPPR